MNRMLLILLVAVLIVIVLMSINGRKADTPKVEEKGFHLDSTGLKTPESVLYDPEADIYLVSNINGAPTDLDDNGFISQVSPTGDVSQLKWIDGTSDSVDLSGPKGMALVGEVLYVADINTVRLFDRVSGDPVGAVEIPGSTFLNDIVSDNEGGVYVSDSGLKADFSGSGTDGIYHVRPDGTVETVAKGEALMHPNGLAMVDGRLLCVPFGGKGLLKIGQDGSVETLTELPTGSLDGIVRTNDGRLLISSWEGKVVYSVDKAMQASKLVGNVESPADIGYDATRNLVLIPLFNLDAISAVPAGQ